MQSSDEGSRRQYPIFNQRRSSSIGDESLSSSTLPQPPGAPCPFPKHSKHQKKQTTIQTFVDKVTKNQAKQITDAIGDFFFACDV